ncbi:TPA: iron-sulfur cluster assembly scaffold protein [Legionella pneumophila]|nr:iron-sulfur cluster assembly scaffold protein [Legionella pneumophila]HDV5804795.1 iron-sulfur cluster assembly scaffold protein [Legionella pneumophila]
MMYNKIVQDYFFQPQHIGKLDLNDPFVIGVQSQPINQLNTVHFYIKCDGDKLISKARFKTNGNPYVIAAMEWICCQIEGKTLESLPLIDFQILINVLQITNNQYPVAIQVEDIYKEALTLMRKKFER